MPVKGLIAVVLLVSMVACDSASKSSKNPPLTPEVETRNIRLVRKDNEKKVDVMFNDQLFTSYCFGSSLKKPVLYPLISPGGHFITRGYPLDPREGERVDHPHHVGLWLNYGDVNGLDFWNNSDAVPPEKRNHYGSVVHKEIKRMESGGNQAELEVTMEWIGPREEVLLEENTSFVFSGNSLTRIIDRVTTLTAIAEEVSFKDNKEGMLGLRVARELEQPYHKPEIFVGADGIAGKEPVVNNEGVSGWYRSSEGIEGDEVWGTRARWVKLTGEIDNERVTVAIMDHPENVGYPTFWHARGYGLFAANPLGQKALSKGKEVLNFKLKAGDSVTFRYRIAIFSDNEVTDEELNTEFGIFAER